MPNDEQTCTAAELTAGDYLTFVGDMPLPNLCLEGVTPDRRPDMDGWLDLSLWPNEPAAWIPAGDTTRAYLGMFGLSVPTGVLCKYVPGPTGSLREPPRCTTCGLPVWPDGEHECPPGFQP